MLRTLLSNLPYSPSAIEGVLAKQKQMQAGFSKRLLSLLLIIAALLLLVATTALRPGYQYIHINLPICTKSNGQNCEITSTYNWKNLSHQESSASVNAADNSVQPGDTLQISMSATNKTATPFSSVTLESQADQLASLTNILDTSGGELKEQPINTFVWQVAEIAPNQTITRSLLVQVKTDIALTASYSAKPTDGNLTIPIAKVSATLAQTKKTQHLFRYATFATVIAGILAISTLALLLWEVIVAQELAAILDLFKTGGASGTKMTPKDKQHASRTVLVLARRSLKPHLRPLSYLIHFSVIELPLEVLQALLRPQVLLVLNTLVFLISGTLVVAAYLGGI